MSSDYNRAVWEVVLANVIFVIFGALMIAGSFLSAALQLADERKMIIAGHELLVAAIVFALLHRSTMKRKDKVMWVASMLCGWTGSVVIAIWTLNMALSPIVVLHVILGAVLLVGATRIRASCPRDAMWHAIQRTLKVHSRARERRQQTTWTF